MTDYLDGCPVCFPGDAPACPPVGSPEQVNGGIITAHQCACCGAAWESFWSEGWPVERLLAPVSPDDAARNRQALERALRPRSAA